MEQKLKDQVEVIEALQKILSNYKKDANNRKTVPYLEKRLDVTQTLWSLFDKNNTFLATFADQAAEQPYYTDNCYDSTKKLYTDIILTLNAKLHEVKTSSDTSQENAVLERIKQLRTAWSMVHIELTDVLMTMDSTSHDSTMGSLQLQMDQAKTSWKEYRNLFQKLQSYTVDDERA